MIALVFLLLNATQAPPQVNAVVNAASFSGSMAPGSLAALFGSGLADAEYQDLFDSSRNAFPTTVAGITVTVRGIPAALTYVSPGQINFQVPWETPVAPAAVAVVVTRNGAASNAPTVTFSATAPSVFAFNGVAIVSCFNSGVTAGAVCTLWGNGFGPKNSPQQDGVPASASSRLAVPCSLTIGGHSAEIQYCGAAPEQIIDQLNFVYPAGVPVGAPPVDAILTIGSASGAFKVPAPTGASYYVSPSGNDVSPGTQGQPFATIQAAVKGLHAGDTLFVRGGEYHEAVSVGVSGTAAAPITIQAYPGECPILIGAKPVPGPWALHSGAIYKAAWPTQPRQVFSDGRLLNEARWPNTAIEDFAGMTYALADSGAENFIAYANLPPVDLTGAWVHIMAGEAWVAYSRQISFHDRTTGKLSYLQPINAMSMLIPRRGNHFYVFGKLELLDSPGEWFWDPAAQLLYVWTPNGAPPDGRIEAGTASAVLDISGQSYITVKGISARGGWFNLHNSTQCTLQDFHLWAPNWIRTFDGYALWPEPQWQGGVDVSGTGNLVERGSVHLAGRGSIYVDGSGTTVRQVTVEDSGWNWSADSGINLRGTGHVAENCTVRRTSATGINMSPRSRVVNNLMENACLFFEDCGNLGSWSLDGQGTEVAYNILRGNHSRWGAGIYLDAGSPNFYLHDNLIQDVLWGGMNITAVTRIENNTMLEAQHHSINFVPPQDADWSAGIVAHNQIREGFPISVSLGQNAARIPGYGWYTAYTTLAPQPGPRRVELVWFQFAQPGWDQQQVPLDLSQVLSIGFALESLADTFNYSITNLRLLPAGGTGDAGAVPVSGPAWTFTCASGSPCSWSASGPSTWGVSGTNAFFGSNNLTAPLPANLQNFSAYRGLAFDLSGTAIRTYRFQGFQDVDNGPEALPGRGARLPASVGADPTTAASACGTGSQ